VNAGEAGTSVLERRCRLLLRIYPPAYRAERGDEILGTLLEAASAGRSVPGWRDAGSLVLAGLCVRAAANHRLAAPANLRLSVMLSLAAWLAASAVSRGSLGLRFALGELAPTALGVTVALAVLAGAAVLWLRTDARPALAVAVLLAIRGLTTSPSEFGNSAELGAAADLAMAAMLRLRFASRPAGSAASGVPGRRHEVNGTTG
jgi:hypothetical protein